MTKAELIAAIALKTGLSKAEAGKIINNYLMTVTKTLKKEGRFAMTGLGTFEVVKRKKRTARNPRTGEPVEIKAHKAVKFKAAKKVKDLLNP